MDPLFKYSLVPALYESGDNGNHVDLNDCGVEYQVLFTVVAAVADAPINMIVQESDDVINWSNVGSFKPVLQGEESNQILTLKKNKRYVRTSFIFETVVSSNITTLVLWQSTLKKENAVLKPSTTIAISQLLNPQKVTINNIVDKGIEILSNTVGNSARFHPNVRHPGILIPTTSPMFVVQEYLEEGQAFYVTCSAPGTITVTIK